MTVTTEKNQETWTADGSSNDFQFTFPILDESHLFVQRRTNSGLLVDMVLGIDYTVTGTGNLPGKTDYKEGKITSLKRNIEAGTTIIITRKVPKTQEVNYIEYGKTPAETEEEALDKLTMITQELNSNCKQSIKIAPDENIGTQISNIKPNDFLKAAPDGSGFIGGTMQSSSGIQSIYEDNTPTLSNTLDTNGHDIRLESNHGLVDTADNPTLTIQHNDNATTNLNIDVTDDNSVIINANGQNEDIDIALQTKGFGKIILNNNLYANQDITIEGAIQSPTDTNLMLRANGNGNTIIDGINISEKFNTIENIATNAETKSDTAISKADNLESIVSGITSLKKK